MVVVCSMYRSVLADAIYNRNNATKAMRNRYIIDLVVYATMTLCGPACAFMSAIDTKMKFPACAIVLVAVSEMFDRLYHCLDFLARGDFHGSNMVFAQSIVANFLAMATLYLGTPFLGMFFFSTAHQAVWITSLLIVSFLIVHGYLSTLDAYFRDRDLKSMRMGN